MGWARFARDSEVYIFDDVRGGITCCGCKLVGFPNDFNCETEDEMANHIIDHARAGHIIPDYLMQTVREIDAFIEWPECNRIIRWLKVLRRTHWWDIKHAWFMFRFNLRRNR